MQIFIIGDVHGCFNELLNLVNKIKFNPDKDKLIFVGDLVGRGPQSIDVVDFIIKLRGRAEVVLGNHDIKFLTTAYEITCPTKADNTNSILDSSSLSKYINWFSAKKLIYINKKLNIAVAHAGIPPQWNITEDALYFSNYFSNFVFVNGMKETLKKVFSKNILSWKDAVRKNEMINYIIFGFTKLRYCYQSGRFDSKYNCPPGKQPKFLIPWFRHRNKKNNQGYKIIYGHWASIGLHTENSTVCCDTGCVWGGFLTAIRIFPSYKIFQVPGYSGLVKNKDTI